MQLQHVLKSDTRFVSPLDKALDAYAARVEALKLDFLRNAEEANALAAMRELRLFKGLQEEQVVKAIQQQTRSALMMMNGRGN
jgi:hypothetical protein